MIIFITLKFLFRNQYDNSDTIYAFFWNMSIKTYQIYYQKQVYNHIFTSLANVFLVITNHYNQIMLNQAHPPQNNLLNHVVYFEFLHYKMILHSTFVVALVFIISSTQAFILHLPSYPWKKCYYSQHSPDKTLEVKMGLIKKQQSPCEVKFQVTFKDGAHRLVQMIHEKNQRCQEGRFRQSYLVKHTPNQQLSQLVSGYYQICITVIQNFNVDIFAEIFIGQKLNPIIYEHSDNPLPLVQAKQLIDLDLTVQSIKKGLVKSQIHAKSIKKHGDQVELKIQTLMQFNDLSIIAQIISLVIFGLTWMGLLRKLKRKNANG